ncbi:MAG: hypothetical protein U1C51_03200, partial [Candidatus Izemoplasmatales bacterium]|nr:hypothetical protein [Candidatus Izemoplasmatales bacterium]
MIQENAIPQKEINSSIDQYQPDESMYLCRRWNIPDTETFNLKMGPLETFVVYKDNKIFGEYSGQQNLILHDIFKESADKIKPRVKAFKFSEGITLAKSNTVDLEFSLMDFVYNVKIGVKINFSLRYHFSDRLVFLES